MSYHEDYEPDTDDDIELEGIFRHETTKAYLIEIDRTEHWIPRSQITGGNFEPEKLQPGMSITFRISAWLADQKGLA